MSVFKNVLTDDILSDKAFCSRTIELINKKTKKLEIEVEFVLYSKKTSEVISFNNYFLKSVMMDLIYLSLKRKFKYLIKIEQ